MLHRINHQEAYSLGGEFDINTNQAESFFSRMRRAEIGHHHHLAGPYLIRFAQEAAWREDHRRDRNGDQVDRIVASTWARSARNWRTCFSAWTISPAISARLLNSSVSVYVVMP